MRILFLNHNVGWQGGTFFRAYEFGRHLAMRGHDVTLVTISKNRRARVEREQRDGVSLVYTPDLLTGSGRTGWDPWDTLRRCAIVGRDTWDIVHGWDSRPAVIVPALWAARRGRRAGTRLVLDWCDWFGRGGTQTERPGRATTVVGPLETWFEERFRTRAHGSTVISRALFQRAVALGVPQDTIRLLPQGCDTQDGGGSREAARERLGLPRDGKILVSIGALIRSDAKLLFDSLALLFSRCPECRFFLIGRHRAEVPEAMRQSAQFTETGFVAAETLRDYIDACDGLLTPLADTLASRARWPSKVNRLLAAGRAVIITRVGDLPALLEREGAALVAGCEPDDIVNQALILFSRDDVRKRCESRGRCVAREQLAWPLLAAQLDEFYATLACVPG